MEDKQRRRIERYLSNADRFLWGVGHGKNQQKTYEWLQGEGFDFTRAKYGIVLQQLLRNPGLEELLTRVIIPSVTEQFPDETLNSLRRFWVLGERPTLKQVEKLEVKGCGPAGGDRSFHWRPFLEINPQFHYVERWGELAGIWFEEIEPYLQESKEDAMFGRYEVPPSAF